LGVSALYENLQIWGHSPWVRTPENVALGYDVGKISSGCLVYVTESHPIGCLFQFDMNFFKYGGIACVCRY